MVQSKLLLKFPKIKHYFFDKNDSLVSKDYLYIIKNCVFPEQRHTNKIVFIHGKRKKYLNCDGLITDKNLFLGVKTADCLPILFYEPVRNIIAAVHAGWRGLLKGIVDNAIRLIQEKGGNNKEIIAVIGPHIDLYCYRVNYERVLQFRKKFNFHAEIYKQGEWYLDLAKIAINIMVKFGINNDNIEIFRKECTYCNLRYPSYRREGNTTNRLLSVIGIR